MLTVSAVAQERATLVTRAYTVVSDGGCDPDGQAKPETQKLLSQYKHDISLSRNGGRIVINTVLLIIFESEL